MLYADTHTVENVTPGHPDKVCDQISDAILDECLKIDPQARVAIDVIGTHGQLIIFGELTLNSEQQIDFAAIAKNVYKEIGYTDKLDIRTNIVEQSADIAQGVNSGGAGDQGIMYGYATDENPQFLPISVIQASALAQRLSEVRQSNVIKWLKPDGKTQVTYQDGKLATVLISAQHDEAVSSEKLRQDLISQVIEPKIGDINNIKILTNPTGRFVDGGFAADSGLTGKKIMVDTYGGLIPHGGGSFSGKDPTKVDRSAAYMCRFAAKNIVAQGYARECLISVAYAIGQAEPVMLHAINENGKNITKLVREKFDFRPAAIIDRLQLQLPIYSKIATFGHFTQPDFPWEVVE